MLITNQTKEIMANKISPYLSAQNLLFLVIMLAGCQPSSKENEGKTDQSNGVKFKLITTDTFHFNNFVSYAIFKL